MKNKKKILVASLIIGMFVTVGITTNLVNYKFVGCPIVVQAADSSSSNNKAESIVKDVESRGLVPCTLSECTFCDLLKLIERIFIWLLTLAFAVAVLFVVISGFAYILSVGDSGMMSWAKEGLKLSIIGFVICLVSWLAIHIIYIVLGYNGKTWWQIECADQSSTSSLETKTVSVNLANEIDPDSLGGRNNPIALNSLTQQALENLPENKYFFIHGIGGQPVQSAAKQLARTVQEARDQKKIVYAVVPYRDKNDQIIGSQKINLNNYLTTELKNFIQEGSKAAKDVAQNANKQTEDQFYSLMINILTKSVTDEIPLIMAKEGISVADFNQKWPSINWNKYIGDGEESIVKPVSSIVNGLYYQEGDGPKFFDPDRFSGIIPENDTHIEINLNPDGSLNLKDPVTISKVAPGVTEENLENYTQQLGKVISELQKQAEVQGDKSEFINNLVHILNQSIEQSNSDPEGSQDETDKDKNDQDIEDTFEQEIQKQNNNLNDEIDQLKQQINLDKAWNTGGTGVLPSRISRDNKLQDEVLLDKIVKQLEKELEDSIRNPNSRSVGGNTGTTGDTGNTGSNQTGNTGGNTSNSNNGTNEPTGNWSGTTLGLKGQLSKDEVKRLDEEIIPKALKDLNLNVPVDFVMCIINKESAFKPGAFNGNGERSIGLTQINTRVGTQNAALTGLKSYVNKNDPNNIYLKLRRDVGSDQVLTSDAGLLSQRDPANERGITSVSMGIGYLKLINAKNGRGNGLKSYSDYDNLAAGYNAGPAGAKGGNTAYSRDVVNCTKKMQDRRNTSGQSPWLQDYDKKKK